MYNLRKNCLKVTLSIVTILLSANLIQADPVIISGGPENDYESWISRLNNGNLMTVFCRNPDWQSGDLYVSFSADNGLTWSNPEAIITGAGDQATLSFVQMPSDTIMLYYASNETGDYKIYSAWSTNGLDWTGLGVVDLGWSADFQYFDPTVVLENDGSLTMSYVVMSNGVYLAHCPSGGNWDTLNRQISNSGYRPRIMKHSNGAYMYAYHKRTGSTAEYDVFITTSTDLDNWTEHLRMTDNLNSHDPFVCEMFDNAYMLSYAKSVNDIYNICCRLSYDGVDWGEEHEITEDATNNTQPHMFIDGHDEFITYAHAVDYPLDHDVYIEELHYMTDIDEDISIAENYTLNLANYPNPFNATTKISFSLSNPQSVRLDIYDILGRKVETLIDREMPAGYHRAYWDAACQSSGMYFARIQTMEKSDHIKLILLK